MKHRIIGNIITGLGNSSQCLLNNQWSNNDNFNEILKQCFEEAIKTFKPIKDFGGLDFSINNHMISFGFEPAYKYQNLYIININLKDITHSYLRTGFAFGYYGSNIVNNYKFYKDYKNKCKFIKFIDKWYKKINEVLENE